MNGIDSIAKINCNQHGTMKIVFLIHKYDKEDKLSMIQNILWPTGPSL